MKLGIRMCACLEAQKFADWLVSPVGQATIAAYPINGQQLFFPMQGAKRDVKPFL